MAQHKVIHKATGKTLGTTRYCSMHISFCVSKLFDLHGLPDEVRLNKTERKRFHHKRTLKTFMDNIHAQCKTCKFLN